MGGFEWDPAKAARNLSRHCVRFVDAAVALEDPFAVTVADPDAAGDARFVTLAADPQGQLLVVVYSHGNENTRIISARRASPDERAQYGRRHA
jgi:uncharacterized DUF497 family protein